MKKLTLIAGLMIAGAVNAAEVKNVNVTEAEVLKAQTQWTEALVQISKTYDSKGIKAASKLASNVLDSAYGYDFGPVLFKPTLAVGDQTFRTTKEGALSYFIGNNKAFSQDSGFALKGWEKGEIKNAAILIQGDTALTMGKVMLTDKKGNVTTVDKTWAFKKMSDGKLKIVLHHSSLPYSAK